LKDSALEQTRESHRPNDRSHPAAKVVHVPVSDPRWLAFASRAPLTLFQSPDWGLLIQETYGFPARVAMILEDDRVQGGLPYAEVDDFRGFRRVVFPFADVCEPTSESLWPHLEQVLCSEGIPWQIRSRVRPADSLATMRDASVHHCLKLPGTVAEASANCHPKQRANVKQALQAGLNSRKCVDADSVAVFYEMHSEVRKIKYQLLPQPPSFFENLIRRFFPQRGFIMFAEAGDVPVSAMLFLIHRNTLYYKFSASDTNALSLRPNHFLIWKAIEAAVEQCYESIDFGISDTGGLARFKDRLGASAVPVYAAHYLQPNKTPAIEGVENTLSTLTDVLTDPRVPLFAAQKAAGALYRFFV
jgi:CelD/BcsL family acetyltransferase involved in cellulose biosynthesis